MRRPERLLAIATLVGLACSKRVDEPAPEVRAHATAEADKPWGKRCVRESPKRPRRAVTKAVDPACPKDPEKPPALRSGKVTFVDAAEKSVDVEIAERDHDRQRGLMYRTSMAEDHGMIFWFEEKASHAFWMHNTCIPLDMLFLDSDGLVVGIEENTPTMSDDTFEVGCESRYVLELNAGWTRAHGVSAGQRVKIDGI